MLPPSRKSLIEREDPNVDGIVPRRLLADTSNHDKYGSSPNFGEIVPVSLLSLAWKICSDSRFEISTGIVPLSLLLKMSEVQNVLL
jgi:hypothetical protein